MVEVKKTDLKSPENIPVFSIQFEPPFVVNIMVPLWPAAHPFNVSMKKTE